ncbi:dephospho-CoA kinase [Phormidesmis sp. 146-33]
MNRWVTSPRIIGLTGGIGMGKTTVSNYLAQNHLPILDADLYARDAVQPGSPILEKIVDRYSSKILRSDSTLDRTQLAEIIFNQPSERIWLDQQIHPHVRQVLTQERDRLIQKFGTIVLVIPLLFEAQMTDLVTEIWVVSCPLEQQIQRLIERGLTRKQAQARIDSQMAIAEKCHQATITLDNSSTLENLLKQVDSALALKSEAATPPPFSA